VKIIISEQLNYIFKRFVLLLGAGKGEREVMVDRYCLNMLGEREVMVDRYCLNIFSI
jgi:formate-dependent phosphoribosylglycinamide formyltransferase (GAR transformylase)